MLRRLLHDEWVIGIAAAIAIGYSVAGLVREVADVITAAAADAPPNGFIIVSVAGREFPVSELIAAAGTLAGVIVLSAFVLRRAGTRT